MAPAIHFSFDHFDLGKNPGNPSRRDVALPANPGLSHASPIGNFHEANLHRALDEDREPQFLEEPGEYRRAACGKTIKVLLPAEFNDKDPDACPACATAIARARADDNYRAKHSTRDWPPPCG